ncbi:ABC transporter [archaeon CG10_big_fil_rev_8_21_14_0_10_43_11]|nr:MAG: ABC transporter [archaeon CG10_big_fil_rev_8_21_14_0_10_43_11]
MLELLYNLFFDYTLRNVALGSATIGVLSGVLGSFAVLRKKSLLGDAISHAALPGIALAFLFTLSKNSLVLLFGAMLAGLAGASIVLIVHKNSKISEDAALGIVLSSFFGLGIFLLTIIQRIASAKKAGLETFLFGNASTMLASDVYTLLFFAGLALALTALFWKEFKLVSFDYAYAKTLGFHTLGIEALITALIVLAIVIGLQTVGVVLMSAFIIAPAVAARQWTKTLFGMVTLSALFGAVSGVSGAMISSAQRNVPTGPVIVIVMSCIVFFSLLFSPTRGIVSEKIKDAKKRKNLDVKGVLIDVFLLSHNHAKRTHPHHVSAIQAVSHASAKNSLDVLEQLGLVTQDAHEYWRLTPAGVLEAEKILQKKGGGPSHVSAS